MVVHLEGSPLSTQELKVYYREKAWMASKLLEALVAGVEERMGWRRLCSFLFSKQQICLL